MISCLPLTSQAQELYVRSNPRPNQAHPAHAAQGGVTLGPEQGELGAGFGYLGAHTHTHTNRYGSVSPSRLEAGCGRSKHCICPIFLSDDRHLSFMATICAGCSIRDLALLSILWIEKAVSVIARAEVKSEGQQSGRACWIVLSFERLRS